MGKKYRGWICIFLALILFTSVYASFPVPSAVDSFENITSYSPEPTSGAMINNSGGTISVININATTQNPRWKAFVGNITGKLALGDDGNKSIFDWDVTSITGEIYATRSSGIIDWTNIECANESHIVADEVALNHTTSDPDSINSTFSGGVHRSFYAGITKIDTDSCFSTATYVDGSAQTDKFQEVVLYDGANVIYSSLLEDSEAGFNNQEYDYQMILPDNALEGDQPNTAYYFYIELV